MAKWTLIPALTFAGFVSAVFTWFIWWPSTLLDKNGVLHVVLGSISLGLALGAVAWFYGLVQSWKILAALVAEMVAAHLSELQAETHAGTGFREYLEIPVVGNVEPLVAATSFAVALVLYIVWVLLTSPRCRVAPGMLLALASAFLASLTITVIHGTQRGAWISFLTGRPLELVWQTAMAFFLGIALAFKPSVRLVPAPSEVDVPRRSFKARIAVISVLAGYFLVTGAWSASVTRRDAARRAQLLDSIKSEAATKLERVPSLGNLPPLRVHPFDEVLVWDNIGEWKPSGLPRADVSPELRNNRPAPGLEAQIAPERKTYYLAYSKKDSLNVVRANVTAYPNEQWARYEADVPPITRQARNIQVLRRFGNNVNQEGPDFFWSSGDYVVNVHCEMEPKVVDEFLEAYLQKHPSNL